MTTKNKKIKVNPWGDDHPEKLNQSGKSTSAAKQLTDLVSPSKMLDQIFGNRSAEGNYYPQIEEKEAPVKKQEFLVFSNKERHEDVKIKQQTEQILETLKKQITQLQTSQKALTEEISKVKVETLPPQTGIYYLRYFEWLTGTIRGIRVKVEEGKNWLAAFNQRQKKRLGYWKKYKKYGTTFGLSHERAIATQTG